MPTLMRSITIFVFACLFTVTILFPTTVTAKASFITDRIYLDVFEKPDGTGSVVFTVFSGSPINILKVEGMFSQIKNKEEKTGWIDNKYISDEKPAQISYLQIRKKYDASLVKIRELQSKNRLSKGKDKLLQALKKVKKDLETLKNEKIELEKSLGEKEDSLARSIGAINVLTDQLTSQRQSNEDGEKSANGSLTPQEFTLSIPWTIAALVLCLFIGVMVGVKWLEHKISKRHGGVNIY